jgi:hypothetical protein
MLLARGLTMRLVRAAACAVMLSCLCILPGSLFFVVIDLAPAAAQQGDLNAIQDRVTRLPTTLLVDGVPVHARGEAEIV